MKLVQFYRDEIPNDEGYFLKEMIEDWTDGAWELSHSHIQWCFPTKQPSQFNPDAPLLTDKEIELFKSDVKLKIRFMYVMGRAFKFYGIKMGGYPECPRLEWADGVPKWLQNFNHNFLRITRILQCLRYLGHEKSAKALYSLIEPEAKKVSENSIKYWNEAVNGPLP